MQNTQTVLLLNLLWELWPSEIVISVLYVSLCNFKTVRDIFLKLSADVYHHDMMMQNSITITLNYLLLELPSFEHCK